MDVKRVNVEVLLKFKPKNKDIIQTPLSLDLFKTLN